MLFVYLILMNDYFYHDFIGNPILKMKMYPNLLKFSDGHNFARSVIV